MEIVIGKHYRQGPHQYAETRKVLSIEGGKVGYIFVSRMEYREVKAATFAKWAGYELPDHEPANRARQRALHAAVEKAEKRHCSQQTRLTRLQSRATCVDLSDDVPW